MKAVAPTYMIDADDPVSVAHTPSGCCHLRIGDGALVFQSPAEAEAAVDEWALALRLSAVGGGTRDETTLERTQRKRREFDAFMAEGFPT